jgi:signal transduction histidine kinase
VADDYNHIAADLHDHVIQCLFAAGLSLQSVAKELGTGTRVSDRIVDNISNLDQTISQIGTTIFQLHRSTGASPRGCAGGCSTCSPT